MLAFFKFLFNSLRNISLVLVLSVVGLSTWFFNNEEAQRDFTKAFKEEFEAQENFGGEEQEEVLGIQAIEESSSGKRIKVEEQDEKMSNTQQNPSVSKISKIAIEKMNGNTIDLLPSEIMYYQNKFNGEKGYLEGYLIKSDGSRIKDTNSSVPNIYAKLEQLNNGVFFMTRYNIINCQQVIERSCNKPKNSSTNHRKCWARMQNQDTIYIDKNNFSKFQRKMKKVSL